MAEHLIIWAQVTVTRRDGEVTGDDASAVVDQCLADAVQGSFGEYPPWWNGALGAKARIVRRPEIVSELSSKNSETVDFSFAMPSSFFPMGAGALQHLVGMLIGDLFPTMLGPYTVRAELKSVELGTEIISQNEALFRSRSHTIAEVREMFALERGQPLLAYSFKPRFGVPFARLREAALNVWAAEFQIVELDTRNLEVNHHNIDQWVGLAEAAAGSAHDRRAKVFSPNLSRATAEAVDLALEWTTRLSDMAVRMIKIDGGLDGLSTLQAIRMNAAPNQQPIITCYPLLRGVLPGALGREWPYYVALSGADIVYPGGRPSFPGEPRPIWAEEAQSLSRASSHYDAHIARGWPMPTAAGGVHPGQLHALYELLGPNVAYFLGGAVALHRQGPAKGARLCVNILDAARKSTEEARRREAPYSNDIPDPLVREIEGSGYPREVNYLPPERIFKKTDNVPYPPKPFYYRE